MIVAVGALARLLAEPRALLGDPDTYLHIAAGRWMLAHATLPVRDPFSYTMAGARWVPHEWLSEIVLAVTYRAAGWNGIVLLTGASFALAIGVLTRFLLRWAEPFSALIVATLAIALTLGHVLARPHILTFPLIVLWSGGLFAAREDRSRPPLRLIPLMTLWANLHGSFMFGLALAAFVAVEAVLFAAAPQVRAVESKRWGGFVLLAAAAALLTPNGIAGFLEPFRIFAMPALKSSFIEWRSPDFRHFLPLEIWFLGIIALGFRTGCKLPPMRLLLLLGLCHMTLQSVRFADLLALAGSLAVMPSLGPRIAALIHSFPASSLSPGMARLAAPADRPATALVLVLMAGMSVPLLAHPIRRDDGPSTPAAALSAARRMGLVPGRVFNSERFGGYLIFEGVPSFIDGRIEMYGNAFLARYVEAQSGSASALLKLLDRYRVTWAMLSPQEGAALRLAGLPGWRRVYADADAVIEARSAPKP